MEYLISILPTIFAFWSGLIITWSAVTSVGLAHIMYKVHQRRNKVRTTDIASFLIANTILIITCMSLFVYADTVLMMIDMMIGVIMWFSLILSYISSKQLVYWPIIVSNRFNRCDRRGTTEFI